MPAHAETPYFASLQDVFRRSAAGVLLLDADLRIIWHNKRTEQVFGVDPDEIAGQPYGSFYRTHLRPCAGAPPADALPPDQAPSGVVRCGLCRLRPAHDRLTRNFEHWSLPVPEGRYAGGRLELFFETFLLPGHVSQQREALLHTIAANIPLILFALDPQGTILLSEGQGLSAMGLHPGQFVGQSVFAYYPDQPHLGRLLSHALQGASVRDTLHLAGRTFDFWCTPFWDREGQLAGTVGVAVDITVPRQTKRALQESQHRHQALFEHAMDAMLLFDDAGGCVEANPAAFRLFGYTSEELTRLSFEELIPPAHHDRLPGMWQTFRQTGRYSDELDFLRKDETVVPAELRSVADVLPGLHLAVLRDVTERRRTAQRLAASEQRWRDLLAHHPETIVISVNNQIRYANAATARLLGADAAEDLTAYSLSDFVLPEDQEELQRRVQALNAGSPTPPRKWEIIGLDGARRYVESLSVPILYEGDLAAQTILRDVTERHRAEQALAAERRFTQQALDTLPDLFFVFDEHGRFLRWNRQIPAVSGYSDDEIAEMEPADFFRGPDRRRIRRAIKAVLALGYTEIEADLCTKDGRRIAYEFNASLLDSDNLPGEGRLICGTGRDISERRRGEEMQRRLAALVTSSNDAIISQRLDGTITSWNAAAERLYGYTALEAIGTSMLRLVPPERQEELRCLLEAAGRGARIEQYEMTHRCRDGLPVDVALTISPIEGHAGHITGLSTIARNITERKRNELALLEAKQHAEEMNRLKTAFLANMSHEIRTPLTSIIGFGDILAEEVHPANREFVELIRRNGQRLMQTLNSVLDLAQLESHTLYLNVAPVDLVAETGDTLQLIGYRAQERGLELIYEAPETPVYAQADRGALDRVLTNLVANAIKFTDQGQITVSVEANAGWAMLRVADTGRGIGEAFLPKLFEEFHQESTGPQREYEGSGLGLAITRRLVEMMYGTIEVDSTPGRGSVFTVCLPAADPPH